jgi:hypothetical protein
MKKSFFLLLSLAIALFSCKKNVDTANAPDSKNEILNFASISAMQNRITEIKILKKQKEAAILEKVLLRNNLDAPSPNKIEEYKKVDLTNLKKNEVLEDLKFYHTERLKSIYELRKEINFTSIQSIAEEINSLKLLNPSESEALYNKYSQVLKKNQFCTSPIFNSEESNVINSQGQVMIESKLNNPIKNDQGASSRIVTEGILANNGIYAITWHAGVDDNVFGSPTQRFTQLASYINLGGGYIQNNSWFYPQAGSFADFQSPGGPTIDIGIVPFIQGAGSVVINNGESNFFTNWFPYYATPPSHSSKVSGDFVTILYGQFITISGSVNFW